MSFGVTDAVVETHMAGLRRTRGTDTVPGSPSPLAFRIGLCGARGRLRNRIGLGLVEAGLHFMVQARESAPPVPYGAAFPRRSSTAHGR
jgi:hypothetical protein